MEFQNIQHVNIKRLKNLADMKSLRTDKCEGGSPYTWVKTVLLGRKTSGLFLTQITRPQKTDLLFPSCVEQKRGLIVTQIKWPQQAVLLFPKYVAAKQAGLLLHKSSGHNKQYYCSPNMWPQNKQAYCYTNYMAATNKLIPQLCGRKTSGLIVTQTS